MESGVKQAGPRRCFAPGGSSCAYSASGGLWSPGGWPGHVQLRKGWRDEFSGVASGQFRTLMFAGPGPALAAAAAWDGLAPVDQAANSFRRPPGAGRHRLKAGPAKRRR